MDIEIEENVTSNEVKFKIEDFEGPLDLLLTLIKERKMDIKTVKLAELTDQYLDYIRDMSLDMDSASSFLTMASWLLEIKSKSLLPHEVEEDDDGIDEEMRLKMYLEEYDLFKSVANELQPLENVNRFYKEPEKSANDVRIKFNDFNLEAMLDAFAMILSKVADREEADEPKKIVKDRWTVAEKIVFIRTLLSEQNEVKFFDLFDDSYSRLEVITIFLSILELLKLQEIRVVQDDRYQDILIKKRGTDDE